MVKRNGLRVLTRTVKRQSLHEVLREVKELQRQVFVHPIPLMRSFKTSRRYQGVG